MLSLSITNDSFINKEGQTIEHNPRAPQDDFRYIPREAKSQKAQLNSKHQHGLRKDVKIKMNRKLT